MSKNERRRTLCRNYLVASGKRVCMPEIMQAEDTIPFFKNGMDLAWSEFTPVGYPKVVPLALTD